MTCFDQIFPSPFSILYPSNVTFFPGQSIDPDPKVSAIKEVVRREVIALSNREHDFSSLVNKSILEVFSPEKRRAREVLENEIKIANVALQSNRKNEKYIISNPSMEMTQRTVQVCVLNKVISLISEVTLRNTLYFTLACQHFLLEDFENATKDLSAIKTRTDSCDQFQELMEDLQNYHVSVERAESYLVNSMDPETGKLSDELNPLELTKEDMNRLWKYNRSLFEKLFQCLRSQYVSFMTLRPIESQKLYQLMANERAAREGYGEAQYNLGYCYENGMGVCKDGVEAARWYRMAADQGHKKAKLLVNQKKNENASQSHQRDEL